MPKYRVPKEKQITYSSPTKAQNNNGKQHEVLPIGLILYYVDKDGKKIPRVEEVESPEEAFQEALEARMSGKFISPAIHLHGGFRKMVWGLCLNQRKEWSERKRGGDMYVWYKEILEKTGWNTVDFREFGATLLVFEMNEWSDRENKAIYKGIALFVENTEKGRELVALLESSRACVHSKSHKSYRPRGHANNRGEAVVENPVLTQETIDKWKGLPPDPANSHDFPSVEATFPKRKAEAPERPPHTSVA